MLAAGSTWIKAHGKHSSGDVEKLRWELERHVASEDGILFIGLCNGCVRRIGGRNRPGTWGQEEEGARFRIV